MQVRPVHLALMGLLLAAPMLASCGATFGRFGPMARSDPPRPPPVVCPPSLKAGLDAEPLPPAGIDVAQLPAELVAFLWGDWLPWGRDKANRLDQARAWCLAQEAKAR